MKDTILIVDDEKILGLMDKMLSKKYNTVTARNGAEGLDAFVAHQDRIKLVITDEMMPIMTGSEMMGEIIKIKPNTSVIFVTGKNKVDYEGGYHMIRKPFNITDFVGTVKNIMDNYQSGSGEHVKIEE